MTAIELHQTRDHYVWAEEFCRIAREKGFDPSKKDDLDWVATWIANAMMKGHDDAVGGPAVLPDGSAFFLAEI